MNHDSFNAESRARQVLRGHDMTAAELQAYQERMRGIARRWAERITPRLDPESLHAGKTPRVRV